MSALRILVPVKRVIDYAVSNPLPPPTRQMLDDWPADRPTVLGESRAEQDRTVVLFLMLMLAPNYVYIYTQQKLTVLPDLDQTPHQQGPNGRRNQRRQALNEPIR